MATKVKEDALIKEKSISAPSTPRRGDIRHAKQPTMESLVRDPSMPEERPIPNYLKPTISSCHHNSCHYLKKSASQPSVVSLTVGKTLPPRKPIDDKSPSPLSTPLRTSCGDRAKVSSDNGFENSPKKTLMRAQSLPRFITKKRDINADISAKKSNGSETQDHTPKKDVESSKQKLPEIIKSPPKRKDSKNNKHYAGFGEEHKNGHNESPKSAKTHRAKAASNSGDGGRLKAMAEGDRKPEQERMAMLKRQDAGGKETLPMYNEVIEETASKLAAKRSKVKALVGAFETVISLQEPEGQTGQPDDDDEVKVQRGEEIEKTSKDSRQQPAETKNTEKKKTKNDRVDQKRRQERGREPRDGRLEQHKLEKEENNTKGCEIGQESPQEEQEELMVNLQAQHIEQHEVNEAELGQESQQDMEISEGGQNGKPEEEVKEVNEEECDEPHKNETKESAQD